MEIEYDFTLIPLKIAKILIPADYDGSYHDLESYFVYNGQLAFFRSGIKKVNDEVMVVRLDQCDVNVDGLLELDIYHKSLKLCSQTIVTSPHPENINRLNAEVPDRFSIEEIDSKTLIDFYGLLNWLIEKKLYKTLESEQETAVFLSEAAKFAPHIFKADNPCIYKIERMVVHFFGQYGYHIFKRILDKDYEQVSETVDIEKELKLEQEINGKLWFELDSLEKHWSKYNLSKMEILHYAEQGKLEICIDWLYNRKVSTSGYLNYSPSAVKAVSPLVNFEKAPTELGGVHSYMIGGPYTSDLCRFVAISKNDISEFIANGYFYNPRLETNGYILVDPFTERLGKATTFTEKDLRVTSRSIRIFESSTLPQLISSTSESKNELGIEGEVHKTRSASQLESNKALTPTVENSHLRVMGGLLELLKGKRTQPYTLELIKTELTQKYSDELGIIGFSKSNLDKIFSSANKALKEK
jgi:hypothetical protein